MCAPRPEPAPAALPLPLVVVAHDAGGAEILSSALQRRALPLGSDAHRAGAPVTGAATGDIRLVLAGPARAVFERRLGALTCWTLDQALDGAASVLTGSGWQSRLEFDAIAGARARGLRCATFLDHWVNYAARFERGGIVALPDELWLGDDDALRLARQALPGVPARLLPNPYFAELGEWFAERRADPPGRSAPSAPRRGLRVLYVCEPIRDPATAGYTDHGALAQALQALAHLTEAAEAGESVASVVVRPHPSESPDKYDAQLAQSGLPLRRGGAVPLHDEIADCDIVVGLNSMAMVVGLIAGKRVLCAIPPGGGNCVLPQRGITMLRDLVPMTLPVPVPA